MHDFQREAQWATSQNLGLRLTGDSSLHECVGLPFHSCGFLFFPWKSESCSRAGSSSTCCSNRRIATTFRQRSMFPVFGSMATCLCEKGVDDVMM